jgi:hypothetical protein
MKKNLSVRHLGLSFLAVGLLACGSADSASPEEAQSIINESLPVLAESAGQGIASISEDNPIQVLFELGAAFEKLSSGDSEFDDESEDVGFGDDEIDEGGLEISRSNGEEFAKILNTKVFTKEQYEEDGYFLLNGKNFCDENDSESECLRVFEEMQLRVLAEKSDGGLQVTLLVGPERVAPITVSVNKTRVKLAIDLVEVGKSLDKIALVSKEEFSLPLTMNGKLSLEFVANENQDLSLALSVLEDVEILGVEGEEFAGLAFTMAASAPTLKLQGNGIEKSLALILNVNETFIKVPGSLIGDGEEQVSSYELALQGLSATLNVKAGSKKVDITNIGFGNGTSTLKAGNAPVMTLDFNKDYNRKMDVQISMENDVPTVSVSPALALSLFIDLSVLDESEEVPSFLAGETYDFLFHGENPTMSMIKQSEGFSGGFKVNSGALELSSSSSNKVLVGAGECLSSQEAAEDAHPIMGALLSGSCP